MFWLIVWWQTELAKNGSYSCMYCTWMLIDLDGLLIHVLQCGEALLAIGVVRVAAGV